MKGRTIMEIEKYKKLKRDWNHFINEKYEFNKELLVNSVEFRDCKEKIFTGVETFLKLSTEIVDKF